MYIELVRRVIEEAIELHVSNSGKSWEEVLEEMNVHIEATSSEHRKVDPQIQYDDPLCRLGYLYMHAAANATLVERVMLNSEDFRLKISNASQGVLRICSMGGGPGTELLGLAKYLLYQPQLIPPRKIPFTVIDNVAEWADTWEQLAEATEEELRLACDQDGIEPPTVAHNFLPYDVFDSCSYRNHLVQFRKFDVVIFNYLFSENKNNLGQAREAIGELARVIGPECVVAVIDRRELNTSFVNDVVSIFESAFGIEIHCRELSGTLDADEQTSEMGAMLTNILKRTPRVKFFTHANRDPTVFWFAFEQS